ncbi:hypothetical protein ACFQ0K_13940 [Nocardioides caeni]|uniref:AbiEi antitoxin C-terminal domain-containing protein n=1 Tax=Nocardioides caeni TaxID=574700 RepID=A0A4S8N0N6_9ACTN|nr:hypothetical protein [Nocardioides caeni]THV09225.1 hypothetical protein E9934_16775 [Nocardioides caeni]
MELHLTRPGLVAPVHVDPTGQTGPTPGQARGPRWRGLRAGWYQSVDSPSTTEQRIVEAVGALPDGCAATGWAALHWLGARWSNGLDADGRELPVPVAVGERHVVRQRAGTLVSEDWLFDDDVIVIDGLPITIPARAVTFEARTADSEITATCLIDMATYDDLVSLDELAAYTARLVARPGKVQLQRALSVASENAWSPMEVVMRRFWQLHHQRPLLCNQPIFDAAGNHLLTPDLLDLEAGVAGEYEGDVHASGRARSRDLGREEVSRRHGIEVVTMMSGAGERARFLHRLEGAYARSRGPGPRSWTIEQPGWWVDTSTVALRRALTVEQRERWLRHRRPVQNGPKIP